MSAAEVREAGDSALLMELDEIVDLRVNARAIAVARAVRDANLPAVRDVVPTYRSVAVHVDPLRADLQAVRDVMTRAAAAEPVVAAGRAVEIPVAYGGASGPDLGEVAAYAGLAGDGVIALHARAEYRVFMLGFMPGFAYLGVVDARIASPRRATPRVRVPAGSVGIAGRQTGVYPIESPGGWQIIGRTGTRMFDAGRSPAALLQPGDSVRFVPVDGVQTMADDHEARGHAISDAPASRSITVLRPGLFTTIQDSGRRGSQASGVPVSGAMDVVAHRVANALVGNASAAATLEVTIAGPELRMEEPATIAITGADLDATVDGASVALETPVRCRAGGVLRFGKRRSGARAYIAVDGGIDVPQVLGSRATHALSKMGGLEGRLLRAGDVLPLGPAAPAPRHHARPGRHVLHGGARLRFIAGPQTAFFAGDALDRLQETRFIVTPQSDRVGYRLQGTRPIPRRDGREMISDATFTGAIQVPPSGHPILLMADRQTTGGYPQIGVVITADLPAAAQLAPGDWIEFEECSRADAVRALVERESRLLALA